MDGDVDPLSWLPGSHRRKPAWRWLRAGYLSSTRRRLDPRIDDDWVAHARLVRRKCGRWPTPEQERCSAITVAFALWQGGDSLLRSKLEAYLLTSAPFARIAIICCLDPTIVEVYHAVFFDVRSRALATDWLLSQAVGWWSATTPDLAQVWKYLAVLGGVNILEVAIAVSTATPLPAWLSDTFENPALDEVRLRLNVKLWILALTSNTPKDWKALAALRKRLRRLEGVDAKESHGDMLLVAMESFLAVSPRPLSISLDEEPRSTGESLIADAADQGDVSTQRHQPFVNVVEAERPITTDLPETPVELLELHHHCSWRSFDAEDPVTVDGIDVERERCRVYVTAY